MAARVKIVIFNTSSTNTPIRFSMGPSVSTSAMGSNAVDTLALNRKGITTDVPFGANNRKVISQNFLVSDVAAQDTLTETTF